VLSRRHSVFTHTIPTLPASVRDLVQQHFREKAFSFDSLYERGAGDDGEGLIQKLVRPNLFYRREVAAAEVARYRQPRVLDIGCGSGRVAEELLKAGAGSYVGVDFSEPMLDLAGKRLVDASGKVRLVNGDFLTAPLTGPFDVSVAVGFFDYIEDPVPFVRRIAELTSGSVVASFPVWHWFKGPVRKVRYEWVNDCPIFNYTPRELDFLFRGAGFSSVHLDRQGAGIILTARKQD
jgi:SAM-dependent methyltransferase